LRKFTLDEREAMNKCNTAQGLQGPELRKRREGKRIVVGLSPSLD